MAKTRKASGIKGSTHDIFARDIDDDDEEEEEQEEAGESDDEDDEIESLSASLQNKMLTDGQLAGRVAVKLVIVDQDQGSKMKQNLRRFISPILSRIDLLPRMGMYHSALLIGPWLIEWNNSSLCVPRKVVSRAAILSADVDAIYNIQDLESAINRISKIIVQWNTTMMYRAAADSSDRYGNCQQFVEVILSALECSTDVIHEGPLGQFLRELRQSGRSRLEFRMDNQFREKYHVTQKSIAFDTHRELDLFVERLKRVDLNFQLRSEYKFLKSFDRAFWLRHMKCLDMICKSEAQAGKIAQALNSGDPLTAEERTLLETKLDELRKQVVQYKKENEKFAPLTSVGQDEEGDPFDVCQCAFGDPMESHSIVEWPTSSRR